MTYVYKKVATSFVKSASMSQYSCEYCGGTHRSTCDTCGMPPCRCGC